MNNNFLDITEESCPYTIVKVKVAISDIEQGEILEILMADGVHCRNIPKVVEFEGQRTEHIAWRWRKIKKSIKN